MIFLKTPIARDGQLRQMQLRLAATQREEEEVVRQIAERQRPEVAVSEAHAMGYESSYEPQHARKMQ